MKLLALSFENLKKQFKATPFLLFTEVFTFLSLYLSLFCIVDFLTSEGLILKKQINGTTNEEYIAVNSVALLLTLTTIAVILFSYILIALILNAMSEYEKDSDAVRYLSGACKRQVVFVSFMSSFIIILALAVIGLVISIPVDTILIKYNTAKGGCKIYYFIGYILVYSLIIYRRKSKLCDKMRFLKNLK